MSGALGNADINRMSTSELNTRLSGLQNRAAIFGDQEGNLNTFRTQLSRLGRPPGTPAPPTPAATNLPPGQSQPIGPGLARDTAFWQNVNRIESLIWQYMPDLDMRRTQQIAISAWEEAVRRGGVNDDTMMDIVRDKLRQANVTMPLMPMLGLPGERQVAPLNYTPTGQFETAANEFAQFASSPYSMLNPPVSMVNTAAMSKSSGLDNYQNSKYSQDLKSVQVEGGISDAVNHLDSIETNTRESAEETKKVKELLQKILDKTNASSEPNKMEFGGNPNYYEWKYDTTSNPNSGGRKPNF